MTQRGKAKRETHVTLKEDLFAPPLYLPGTQDCDLTINNHKHLSAREGYFWGVRLDS